MKNKRLPKLETLSAAEMDRFAVLAMTICGSDEFYSSDCSEAPFTSRIQQNSGCVAHQNVISEAPSIGPNDGLAVIARSGATKQSTCMTDKRLS
ncbi:hypothetical protein DYH55_18710 [Methylovirgula sp. 4M-Z18]|nr:hypothetical protein DYH55_18710 [Methylovirgula sp. 4M-Z18]